MKEDSQTLSTLLESCKDYSSKNEWSSLKETTRKLLDNGAGTGFEEIVEAASVGVFLQSFNEILKNLLEKLDKDKTKEQIQSVADSFRCLRQACGHNVDIQCHLNSCPDLLENTKLIIDQVLSFDIQSDEDFNSVLKCGVQFLGNACAHNDNRKLVWESIAPATMNRLLQHSDIKLCDYTCMLAHQCLSYLTRIDGSLLSEDWAKEVVLTCVQVTAQRDLEWGMFVLEDMLKQDSFLLKLYAKMALQERLLLMEVILAEISELGCQAENVSSRECKAQADISKTVSVSPGNLYFIAEDVKREFSQILNLESPDYSEQEKTLVIVKELEVLAGAAAYTHHYPKIQADQELLKCAISLLRSVHDIGKTGNNVFSKVEKASRHDEINPHHPVYGLKKDLIRLIANMAFHNKENQDLTRTLEGIPLLLDQTSIDCHNPFITQWVVLAIRNLLENNPANRAIMSGMSLQGMAGHMGSLREMGIETELRGGKIVVKPADDSKK